MKSDKARIVFQKTIHGIIMKIKLDNITYKLSK